MATYISQVAKAGRKLGGFLVYDIGIIYNRQWKIEQFCRFDLLWCNVCHRSLSLYKLCFLLFMVCRKWNIEILQNIVSFHLCMWLDTFNYNWIWWTTFIIYYPIWLISLTCYKIVWSFISTIKLMKFRFQNHRIIRHSYILI
jgi:hypothetical protein